MNVWFVPPFPVCSPDTHPDAFPNQMTPCDSTLRLVDAGHAINLGCVPVLRPQRNVDVIISLSYSWDKEHIFKVRVGVVKIICNSLHGKRYACAEIKDVFDN